MELNGLNVIHLRRNMPLNPLRRDTIITSYNLIMDPVMWMIIFTPFWSQWKPGYSPKFIHTKNRITTTAINTSSQRSREEEIENSIRTIIAVHNQDEVELNLNPLMNQIITRFV